MNSIKVILVLKYGYFAWHTDDYEVAGMPVYTILYYIRKDKTIKGGNSEYRIKSKKNIHIVNEKDIYASQVLFNITHNQLGVLM